MKAKLNMPPALSMPSSAWIKPDSTRPLLLAVLFHVCALGSAAEDNIARALLPPPEDRESILRVQIYLDSVYFPPGRVDGSHGPTTEKALALFNRSRGLTHSSWELALDEAEANVTELYQKHTVEKEHWKFITSNMPSNREAQSRLSFLGYTSMIELILERYHTTPKLLETLNPEVNLYGLKTGSTIWVPHVKPFRIEQIPRETRYDFAPALSNRKVFIDTKERVATVYDGDSLMAAFPIVPGQEKFIHRGKWVLLNMVTFPGWRYDKSLLTTGKRSNNSIDIPPGPNNPVGVLWAGISKSGIGMHGTNAPEIMGYAASSGCIRFANWDIVRLSDLIRPGATVTLR